MKRILSCVLAGTMVLGSFSPVNEIFAIDVGNTEQMIKTEQVIDVEDLVVAQMDGYTVISGGMTDSPKDVRFNNGIVNLGEEVGDKRYYFNTSGEIVGIAEEGTGQNWGDWMVEEADDLTLVYDLTSDLFGYQDESGNMVIPYMNSYGPYNIGWPSIYNFFEGYAVYGDENGFGYIDVTGEIVIPPIYDFVRPFSEGLAFVENSSFIGYINKAGEQVIDTSKYRATLGTSFNEGFAFLILNTYSESYSQYYTDIWNWQGYESYSSISTGEVKYIIRHPDTVNTTYTPLPSATLYTSYLTTIPNMSESATLVSGALPSGLGLYPDGTIGGIPTKTGTFEFVVSTASGEVGYSITVQSNTSANVEADNDFTIIERIPTVTSNNEDYIYEVSGEYSQFLNVYLNGTLLITEADYLAEEGSTKITILADTMAQLNTGSHTINATFTPVDVSSTSTSANVTVEKVAQTFEKTVAKTTEPAMPFTDVAESDWFYDYVLFVYKKGTFSGTSETTYSPSTSMNRAMMASVLYALAEKPETESANLSDVAEGIWYEKSVNWVVSRGIDDSTDNFRPEEAITREETAKMMYNFCIDQGIWLPLVTSSSASDMGSVSTSCVTAVDSLYQRNIFSGDDEGNFNPQETSNRDAIAVIVKNFISVVM